MFASHAYLWPLVVVTGGTVIVSVLHYLTLYAGLRLALKGALRADRLPIYREFARALEHQGRPGEHGGSPMSDGR